MIQEVTTKYSAIQTAISSWQEFQRVSWHVSLKKDFLWKFLAELLLLTIIHRVNLSRFVVWLAIIGRNFEACALYKCKSRTQTLFSGVRWRDKTNKTNTTSKQRHHRQYTTSGNRQCEGVGHSIANAEASRRCSSSSRVALAGPKWMSSDSTSIRDGKKMLCVHAPWGRRYKWGLRSPHEAHNRSYLAFF